MLFDDPFCNGQAQAGPTGIAATRGVRSEESFENMGQCFLRDPYARVPNGQNSVFRVASEAKSYLPISRRVFDGIIEKDKQELLEPVWISHDDCRFHLRDLDPLTFREMTCVFDGFHN